MTNSILKTAVIAIALVGSLSQLSSAQVQVMACDWGNASFEISKPHDNPTQLIVGGDVSTWSPTPYQVEPLPAFDHDPVWEMRKSQMEAQQRTFDRQFHKLLDGIYQGG